MVARVDSRRAWLKAAAHALPITAFILAMMGYWFAVADRYIVFLYYHDTGRFTRTRHRSAGSLAAATG